MRFVLIDESIVDRGWYALVSGIDLKLFKKNPVMLWMHQRAKDWESKNEQKSPIGRWDDIKIEEINGVKSITAEAVFDENDPFAKQIKDKVENNFLRMASAGLLPITVSDDQKFLKPGQTRSTLVKSEMREASIVDIGGNKNAIRLYDENRELINLSDQENLIIPTIKLKENKDMKLIALKLGLKEDATEAQMTAKIEELTASEKSANDKFEALQAERVEVLLTSESLSDDDKETVKNLAKQDFNLAAKFVQALDSKSEQPEERLSAVLKKKKIETGKTDKKWADLSDEERITLRDENSAEYVKLYAEHYGVEPKID